MNHLVLPDTTWITAGNELDNENCVSVAVANHLLYHTGIRLSDEQVDYLSSYHRRDFAGALRMLDVNLIWTPGVGLSEYGMLNEARPGDLVGFDVEVEGEKVAHAGLLVGDNMVVSWGEVVPLPTDIDEVWEIVWTVTKTNSTE